jgi:lipopolysaccharide/colanic/teichoic acid biosynthesis glycosyltransferase
VAVLDRDDSHVTRLRDLVASLAGLVLLGPVFLVVAVLIKVDSPGPVFFRAERVGKGGQPFFLYKFRTMMDGAHRSGPGLTVASDQRITRLGGWLRRNKIDELPQLMNVLKGEMSLVGPRPEDPTYVALYTLQQRQVLANRPGITSPATLQYRHEADLLRGKDWEHVYVEQIMPHKLRMELDYLEQRTFWTDMAVVFQTLLALFQ